MNLADYLTELLSQRNQVSVPGLGFFERVRVNGYYNEEEAKFYPPSHQVKFSPETKDDDSFTQYVADKKNISLASSKYFTEKFVSKLREDAAAGDFPFSGLGTFRTNNGELVFKPNDKIANDPSLYGYEAVSVPKTNLPPIDKAEVAEPVITEPAEIKLSEEEAIKQEHIQEEEETKRSFNIWIGIMIFIFVAALAVFGAYRYDPSIFDRFNDTPKAPVKKAVLKKVVTIPDSGRHAKADSAKRVSIAADSTKSAAVFARDTTTYDTLTQRHYAITVDAFKGKKTAGETVNHYKSLGLDAKLLPREPRHLYRVIVGRYTTLKAAQQAKLELVNEKKIRRDAKILTINPKK